MVILTAVQQFPMKTNLRPAFTQEYEQVSQTFWLNPVVTAMMIIAAVTALAWLVPSIAGPVGKFFEPIPTVYERYSDGELVKVDIGGKEILAADLTSKQRQLVFDGRYQLVWYGDADK
ncbi:MAG: hypothetical protein KGH68_03725 [Patescibacteria group bacterium]|nr:hypothetical protein [Patescibacteria group bacterium]